MLCAALVAAGCANPVAGAELSPRYTITIPAPGARIVRVHVELDGVTEPSLPIAFLRRSGPALEPSVNAYRIRPVARQRGGSPLTTRSRRTRDRHLAVFDVRASGRATPLGNVDVDYELDLAAALGGPGKWAVMERSYHDRMVVTDRFATLRGDTLCFPMGADIVNPVVKIVSPPGWRSVINTAPSGDGFVFRARFPAAAAEESVRWFGLCGSDFVTESRSSGSITWTLTLAPTPADTRSVARTVWDRVHHYTATFGLEPLADLRRLQLFGIPYPPELPHSRGGQYLPGTAYFFYAPGCPDSLGHVVAHEYLHAYNGRALHRRGGVPWFREAFTDALAILVDLGLAEPAEAARLKKLRVAIAEMWAIAANRNVDQVVASLGLSSPAPHAPGAPPAAASAETADYDRELARRTLAVFGLALHLERSRPGRAALDGWLRLLLKDREQGTPLDEDAVQRACLEAAGTSGALEEFYRRYVRGGADVPLEMLREWLRDDALRTMCPSNRGRGVAGKILENRTIDSTTPAVSSH